MENLTETHTTASLNRRLANAVHVAKALAEHLDRVDERDGTSWYGLTRNLLSGDTVAEEHDLLKRLTAADDDDYEAERADMVAATSGPPLIVSRHAPTVEWLERYLASLGHENVEVLDRATPRDLWGRTVWGNLPFHLAVHAEVYLHVDFRVEPPSEDRGSDFDPEDYEPVVTPYRVRFAAVIPQRVPRPGW